jgi:hypothetical protein
MTGSEPKKNYGSLDTSDQEPSERKVPRWMALHTFAVMGFLGQANVYALRVNLNVAIVAMVNTSTYHHDAYLISILMLYSASHG